jgi:SAM-dependent methyltransferase
MRRIPFRADNEILAASDGSKTPHRRGRIIQYRSDIMNMQMLPDGFVDATISISALEHNDDEGVENCVKEMLRVTRPGGILAVTVSASVAEDWFHEPSKGWCYSEGTLKKLFGLPASASSNFSHREALLAAFRKEDNELHRRLASFYYQSGDNGMPWGKWDPQYLPVGVVREKGR